jgi:hypothetical protein
MQTQRVIENKPIISENDDSSCKSSDRPNNEQKKIKSCLSKQMITSRVEAGSLRKKKLKKDVMP